MEPPIFAKEKKAAFIKNNQSQSIMQERESRVNQSDNVLND
jgi:hypothetical protein